MDGRSSFIEITAPALSHADFRRLRMCDFV